MNQTKKISQIIWKLNSVKKSQRPKVKYLWKYIHVCMKKYNVILLLKQIVRLGCCGTKEFRDIPKRSLKYELARSKAWDIIPRTVAFRQWMIDHKLIQ